MPLRSGGFDINTPNFLDKSSPLIEFAAGRGCECQHFFQRAKSANIGEGVAPLLDIF
jgi:hypothetical protein